MPLWIFTIVDNCIYPIIIIIIIIKLYALLFHTCSNWWPSPDILFQQITLIFQHPPRLDSFLFSSNSNSSNLFAKLFQAYQMVRIFPLSNLFSFLFAFSFYTFFTFTLWFTNNCICRWINLLLFVHNDKNLIHWPKLSNLFEFCLLSPIFYPGKMLLSLNSTFKDLDFFTSARTPTITCS